MCGTEFFFLVFTLKNRYDAISFNINNWKTVLKNLKKIVICVMKII